MDLQQWIKSDEFFTIWKSAFSNAKSIFAEHSPRASVLRRKYPTGAIWTEVRNPFPGVHLVAVEIQPSVLPLTLNYRVWVEDAHRDLYGRLIAASNSVPLGMPYAVVGDQRPPANWAGQLRSRGISLTGLIFKVRDIPFLVSEHDATAELEDLSARFFRWFLNVVTDAPSSLSHGVGSVSVVATPPVLAEPQAVIYPEEVRRKDQYLEGATMTFSVNVYERNSAARRECIERYGFRCQVCNLGFEEQYGDIGKEFIHVHHLIPLASVGKQYLLDPIKHLRPVCPNCHSMLHKKEPPYSIEELRNRMSRA